MSINLETVQRVLAAAKQDDQTLAVIQQAAQQKNLNLKEPAQIAAAIGNLLRGRGSNESVIIATMVDAFKGAAYAVLVKNGERFPDSRHDNLSSAWNKTVEILKQAQNQQNNGGGSLLGGNSGGGGLLGGNSNSTASDILGNASGQGILVQNNPLTVSTDTTTGNTSAGLNSGAGTSSILAGTANNAQPAPAAAATSILSGGDQIVNHNNEPVTSLVVSVNDQPNLPVINIMDPKMETYAEHELSVEPEHVSKSPKKANTDVKLYKESDDWRTPLRKIFNGESTMVYFSDADICVRMNEISNSYLVGNNDADFEIIRNFFEQHRASLSNLSKLSEIDDVEKLISTVMGTIEKLIAGAKGLYDQVNEGQFSTVTVAAETMRFVNSYLYMVDILAHNATALVTNRGTDLPTGKVVELERKAEDLEYFAETVFAQTTGDNGVSDHEEWFRDLFLTVAVSLRKLKVSMDGNGQALTITTTTATVLIPGNYASVDKANSVSVSALGATAEAVTEIYEEMYKELPHVHVIMELPNKQHVLLSTGEVTSAIRY